MARSPAALVTPFPEPLWGLVLRGHKRDCERVKLLQPKKTKCCCCTHGCWQQMDHWRCSISGGSLIKPLINTGGSAAEWQVLCAEVFSCP